MMTRLTRATLHKTRNRQIGEIVASRRIVDNLTLTGARSTERKQAIKLPSRSLTIKTRSLTLAHKTTSARKEQRNRRKDGSRRTPQRFAMM
jgi:hypothetical protein